MVEDQDKIIDIEKSVNPRFKIKWSSSTDQVVASWSKQSNPLLTHHTGM